jgi:hypothetical protein
MAGGDLKQQLLEGQHQEDKPPSKKLFSSQNTLKLLKSKMSILESTLCIIESVMNDLRDSTSYA